MKLPNLEQAEVPRTKIVDYLLSSTHRDGKHKAAFFVHFGFEAARWELLRDALLKHANEHEVTRTEESPFGVRYVLEGRLPAPDGRTPRLRSVWFIETDSPIQGWQRLTLCRRKMMLDELSTVALTEDLPAHGLRRGDLGTIVLVHAGKGYEVEFLTLDGENIAVASLHLNQVRPVGKREVAQARALEPVS
jgi:hypothetical protein